MSTRGPKRKYPRIARCFAQLYADPPKLFACMHSGSERTLRVREQVADATTMEHAEVVSSDGDVYARHRRSSLANESLHRLTRLHHHCDRRGSSEVCHWCRDFKDCLMMCLPTFHQFSNSCLTSPSSSHTLHAISDADRSWASLSAEHASIT